MKIAVVILNFNLPADTLSLIRDLEKQVLPQGWSVSVIVVDNASTDNSVEIISSAQPGVKVLPQPKNLGVAGGYNAGIKYALVNDYDYIVLTNNDILIEQINCLEVLIKELAKNGKWGIAAPLIYFAKGFEYREREYQKQDLGKVIWYAGGKIDWANVYPSHRGVDEVNREQFSATTETDFITGAFMVFKSAVFRRIGLFNENYHLYLEDVEISQRARKAGFKLLFVPKAKIAHKVSQTSGNAIGGPLNDYYTTRNRLLFGFRYASLRSRFALLREAVRLFFSGREYQREGIKDFFLGRLGQKENLAG